MWLSTVLPQLFSAAVWIYSNSGVHQLLRLEVNVSTFMPAFYYIISGSEDINPGWLPGELFAARAIKRIVPGDQETIKTVGAFHII